MHGPLPIVALLTLFAGSSAAQEEPSAGLYHRDPGHAWNRVHRALFVRAGPDGRAYGLDALDPYLWPESTWLLEEPRLEEARAALAALQEDGQALESASPVARALMQRDLWAVFDWVAERSERPAAVELARELARAMQLVALARAEIAALPHNGALAAAAAVHPERPPAAAPTGTAFLPRDLFGPEGPWVSVQASGPRGGRPLAQTHAEHFAGRSAFEVLVRLPGGRAETLEYLARLRAAPRALPCARADCSAARPGEERHLHLDPEFPQPPAGTALALLRRALLVDPTGRLHASPLVESVQLRVLVRMDAPEEPQAFAAGAWLERQAGCELRLSRRALLAGEAGGLLPLGVAEPLFEQFMTHGLDPFDESAERFGPRPPSPARCLSCHGGAGILSAPSFTGIASGPGTLSFVTAPEPPPALMDVTRAEVGQRATSWKARRFDWGLWRGLTCAPGSRGR